MLTFFL